MSFVKLYDDFFSQRYTGLAKFYNRYVKHDAVKNGGDAGLGGLACRMIWAINFTSYEYTPTNLINGNQNTHEQSDTTLFKDSMTKITSWINNSNMFAHMESLCCKVDMPNFSITQQVDGTKGKVTVDNVEGIYQTVGGSPIWGDKDTIKLTFYETQIPLIENYIWPWLKTCRYSYISNKDVFSIPRMNMHVYLYPDDINTETVFKYIVYGMYPISFDSFQPSHEKKTSIDKRGVTFAYNNITVEQDNSFVMDMNDYWTESTVGQRENQSNYGDKKPGTIGSDLTNNNDDNSKNNNDKNNTKITNTKKNDKDQSDLEAKINNINLNGNPNDGLNTNVLPDTTNLLQNNELNGGNNNLTNKMDTIPKDNNTYINNTSDVIDTVSLLDPTKLSPSDNNYLNTYDKLLKTKSNNLQDQITKSDKSISLEDALSQYNGDQKSNVDNNSDNNVQAKTDANNDQNNINQNNSDKRINQLSDILNQLQNQSSSQNSKNSNNGNNSDNNGGNNITDNNSLKTTNDNSIKNKTADDKTNIKEIINAKGLARTYSVVKDNHEDQNNGWGKSGGSSSLDIVIDDSLKEQIQNIASSQNQSSSQNSNNQIVDQTIKLTDSLNNNSTTSSDLNYKILSKDKSISLEDALRIYEQDNNQDLL